MGDYTYSKLRIKEALDLRDVFNFYGINVATNGFCNCFIHNERTPSCKVHSNRYHCFGCGESGDIFNFIQKLFNLDFQEAMHKLNDDFALNLPLGTKRITANQKRHAMKITTLQNMKKRKLEMLENTYWKLYDKMVRYEKIIKTQTPKIDEENTILVTNEYIEAVTMLPKIEYELDLVGEEINEFKHRNYNKP